MNRVLLLMISFCLSGCFIIDLYPPYSKIFDGSHWEHRQSNKELPMETHLECYKHSIKPFKTKKEIGADLEYLISTEDLEKSEILYADCVYQKGYRFKASYVYCYRYEDYCDLLKKYRK